MIVIVRRDDLQRSYREIPSENAKPFHFGLTERALDLAELIVLLDDGKVYVMYTKKWPFGKPMSAAELLQYLANHAA
jgi:hypothetical protein